ncbi:hypothetical protein BXZ70DRAFT_905065 [Cristinia sonorae]|uniref:RING-type domain-containing protein n=1 Tax=Cristinia sonorae TaxID=1940300 RepID=A0A8K0UW30_9AGAR|nr:hypothetical protein BXZ70DRAFT_905065 [Cristinia sonorae]
MPTCVLCLEVLKDPAALPCGHVFCYECLVQLVRNVQPYVHTHFCPTCRHPYTTTTANPNLVPQHLRPYITPSIRRLSLAYTLPKSQASPEPLETECARLRAENASLKACCGVWSKRARLHAGTTLGLIGMMRVSKDIAMRTRAEKEEVDRKYAALKRSVEETRYDS